MKHPVVYEERQVEFLSPSYYVTALVHRNSNNQVDENLYYGLPTLDSYLINFYFSAPIIWQPPPSTSSQSTVLVDINRDDPEFNAVGEVRIL